MNDDNEKKCYGVSTDFIRKLTDSFFIAIGKKASTNIPSSKIYRLRKIATLPRLYGPMYLELEDYLQYSLKIVICERHINRILRFINEYTDLVPHNYLIIV